MELGEGSSAKRKVWPANVKAKEIRKLRPCLGRPKESILADIHESKQLVTYERWVWKWQK